MQEEIRQGQIETELTLDDLAYDLPRELIAQHPLPQRDDSRLLVVDRANGGHQDSHIRDLPNLLEAGDLLVLNDTKVLRAKLTAKRPTGGKVRGLFVHQDEPGIWQVMLEGSRRLRVGEILTAGGRDCEDTMTLELLESLGDGFWKVRVSADGSAEQVLERIGQTPLPPYIRRGDDVGNDREDRARYQTVYARHSGAIAAPTAGLHLTGALLDQVRNRGVETAFVTLHVGVGTFKPIEVDDLSQHRMHSETFEVPPSTAEAIDRCRTRGGRVVAVGTTTVRALESSAAESADSLRVVPCVGDTDLFIRPPFRFKVVDALLTNFHLPGSSLLALIMALAGVDTVRRAYAHAIQRGYRFYSYGDAMLIR